MKTGHTASWSAGLLMLFGTMAAPGKSALDSLDLYAPELQQLKASYIEQVRQLDTSYRQDVGGILEEYLDQAKEDMAEKKHVRNVKGMMIARNARKIFSEALSALKEKGDFTLPEQVRRELQETIAACRSACVPLRNEHREALAQLKTRSLEQFKQLAQQQLGAETMIPETQRETAFEKLLATADQRPEEEKPAEKPQAQTAPPTKKEPPEFFAESSPDTRCRFWAPFARWTGAMRGPDLVSIPIINRVDSVERKKKNGMTGLVSDLTYESLVPLPENPAYQFRLKRLPDLMTVEVIEWPTKENGWTLLIRTQQTLKIPAMHGFELQACIPGENLISKLVVANQRQRIRQGRSSRGGAPIQPHMRMVSIPITTIPERAEVFVDGKPARDEFGKLITPCTLSIAPGRHALLLKRAYFKDKEVKNYVAMPGKRIKWIFEPADDLPWKEIKFKPRRGWKGTGIKVWDETQFIIQAKGHWVCGRGGEPAGPTGYPRAKFPQYYEDAKLLKTGKAPYGALIMRIGLEGETNIYNHAAIWQTGFDQGEIYLDINETEEDALRRNNRGELLIRIAVLDTKFKEQWQTRENAPSR